MSDAPATDTAQTYGWDTVFAVHIADTNAAILAAGTSPPGWSQADAAGGYAASGSFGAWSIVPGGSGDLVRLCLPLTAVSVTGPAGQEQAAGSATADIRLDLLADAEAAGSLQLKVRTTPPGDGIPVASVVDLTFTGTAPSFLAGVAVKQLLQDWLNANLGDFDHVFCTVALNRTAASGAFQWLQPTDTAYAYTDLGTAGDGALAILSMTGGRSATGLVQQVSSSCIPPGQRAALMVSKARTMDQLLLPAMPVTFSGTKATDFTLSPTGEAIVNAGQSSGFTVTSNGKTYTSVITALSATISGTDLVFDVTTATEVSPGIHVYTRCISNLLLGLGAASGQGQALAFTDASKPVVTHWNAVSEGIRLTEEILGVIALIAAVVASVLTDGAAVGAIALAIGFAAGVMGLTTQAITWADKNGAPAIGAAVLDATAAICWPQGTTLSLAQAGLSDSLQLSGTLVTEGATHA